MIKLFTTFCMLAFFLPGCSQTEQVSRIGLSNDGHLVDLSIPNAYLQGNTSRPPDSSVWIKFNYPNLTPASSGALLDEEIPVLILNIADKRTRAEYILDAEVAQSLKSEFLERKKPSLEIDKSVTDRQGSTYEIKTVFLRADDGSVIHYEVVPDLRISVSRRYSKSIELRYVISSKLFHEREKVDASVVSLLHKFSKSQ